jgi:methylenetetrahydrofolate reductase (NADPH)
MNRFHVDAVPHLICGGFTKEETENALIDLDFLGIDNVLALRGDHIKSEGFFTPEPGGHAYASDLIVQIKQMNAGKYLDEELKTTTPTDFCIGVAGYPEKHFEAANMETELKYTKLKCDLGGEYIVTQMFFDNKPYFEFVKRCRDLGITAPVIPGLKPITTKKQLTVLPRIFALDIPQDLVSAIESAKDDKAVRQIGVEWCTQQSKELMDAGVPVLHYYSMGKSDAVKQIASQLF